MFWICVSVAGLLMEMLLVVALGRSVTRPYEESADPARPAMPPVTGARLPETASNP